MDIVVINNGLGNQMSQYAFYLAKKKTNSRCRFVFDPDSHNEHNGSELDKLFGIKFGDGLIDRLLSKIIGYRKRPKIWKILSLCGVKIFREAVNYDYDPQMLKRHRFGFNFFIGGWHSEKYFKDIREDVLDSFSFPSIKSSIEYQEVLSIVENTTNSVSIHVRRGDFLTIDKNNPYQLGGVATESYYKKALSKIKEKVDSPLFFCFSNDIKWCREFFKDENVVYVTCNTGKDSWRDMYLMSLCKHHINANSTFSWWGVWLSQKEGITICPEKFLLNKVTKDIYPESWIKIK